MHVHGPKAVLQLLLYALLILSLSAADAREQMYVQGDVVNLRKSASPFSEVVDKLYIGTSVDITTQQEDDWVYVEVNDRLASGWIQLDFLTPQIPTLEQLLANYHSAPSDDMDKKCMWLSRANALEPLNLEVLALFRDCKLKTGDQKLANLLSESIAYIRNPDKYLPKDENRVVFYYSNNTIAPLTLLDGGLMTRVYSSNESRDRFISQYAKVGRQYHLLSHLANPVAKVRVAREPLVYFKHFDECESPVDIQVSPLQKSAEQPYTGFVTNFLPRTKSQDLSINVPDKLLQQFEVESAAAITSKNRSWDFEVPVSVIALDTNHDGKQEYLTIKKYLHQTKSENESDAAFFVVMLWQQQADKSYQPVYRVIEGMNEKYAYIYVSSYEFVGAIDMDDDGIDEIVISMGVYEGSTVEVLSFKYSSWLKTNISLYYGTC
ncbi:MAG: SH3 domain-containing protein [Gammaproteobacteria bacterium]|nr:SH3 domain-containing protein [Gammaproteobacteria bacterium]MDH5653452.1 SH3 domain-containing protein [Gammaproteobacteria bacterium]